VQLAERDSHLLEVQRKQRAQNYADRAMATLRKAVQSGYKDLSRIKNNKDLDPLRPLESFKKLVSELESARPTVK
jgi:hypothetical protein